MHSRLATTALTALLSALFLIALLARRDWNPTTFVMIGSLAAERDSLPAGFAIEEGVVGYDGRYFYDLAQHPLAPPRAAFGLRLESPTYRQQRILYPLLIRLFALGQIKAIPWAMIAVNFLALTALGWLGATFALAAGRAAFWGLVFPLHIGFVTSFSRDLSEILECTLAVAALLALRRQRIWATGILLSLAVLAKEPSLLVAVAIGLVDLFTNRRLSRTTRIAAGLPLATYILWHLWLIHYWGPDSLNVGTSNQGWPLAGYWNAISWGIWHWHWPWAIWCLLLPVMVIAVLSLFRATTAPPVERCAWTLYAILIASLSTEVWGDNHAFIRAASELSLLGAIIILSADAPKARWLLVLSVGAAVQVV